MWSDIQYALRNIAKKPLFYSVVILTFALGISANAAIFTVVNGVLLQPLPYPHPERLMMVWTHNPRQGFDKDVGTYPNFEDWRRASQSFERLSAYSGASIDGSRADAQRAESEILRGRYRGPLHGIPLAVKDTNWTSIAIF